LACRSSQPAEYGHISIANRVHANNQVQRCLTTTKDTKSTKESEYETLDAIFQFGVGRDPLCANIGEDNVAEGSL
jgi:hypothetical protein